MLESALHVQCNKLKIKKPFRQLPLTSLEMDSCYVAPLQIFRNVIGIIIITSTIYPLLQCYYLLLKIRAEISFMTNENRLNGTDFSRTSVCYMRLLE